MSIHHFAWSDVRVSLPVPERSRRVNQAEKAMVIVADDENWEKQVVAAFKQRVEFELRSIDKLELPEAQIFKTVAQWSVDWRYSPAFIGTATIHFRPDESPCNEPTRVDIGAHGRT